MTEMIVLTQGKKQNKKKAVTGPVGLGWWHTCSVPPHWGKQYNKSDNRCYRCIFTDYIIKVYSKWMDASKTKTPYAKHIAHENRS